MGNSDWLSLDSMTIRSFIVEDEPLARKSLRELVAEISWLTVVGEAGDGLTAVQQIDELKPQLLFLDIDLPELNGLEVLARVSQQPEVVFTTAYDTYALSAFEFDALDYLLKPFGRERFQQMLERVKRRLFTEKPPQPVEPTTLDRARHALQTNDRTPLKRLFVRDGEMLYPILTTNIIRLEASDDYTTVYVKGKRYLIHVGLSDFTSRLDPEIFLRVHRSHTINLNHVSSVEDYDRRFVLYMTDGSEVTASRSGSQEFRRLFTCA